MNYPHSIFYVLPTLCFTQTISLIVDKLMDYNDIQSQLFIINNKQVPLPIVASELLNVIKMQKW